MTIDELDEGSRWYVQLAPKATLVEMVVDEITELTVVLRDPNSLSSYNTSRYRFDEIEFIEAC